MDRCPSCGLMLEATQVAGRRVDGCRECGGVWVSAADLQHLAKEAPTALGELEQRFSAGLSAHAHGEPTCGRCGHLMPVRHFPVAPDLALHACGQCKMIWLADGQAAQLQAVVAPESVRPRWEAAAEQDAPEEDDEEPEIDVYAQRGHGPLGLWPERMDGQPWGSWIVCGMPLWLAPLLLLISGTFLWASLNASTMTQQVAAIGFLVPFAMWLVQAVVLTMALHTIWAFGGESPDLGVIETFLLLLRVVPVSMALSDVVHAVATAVGGPLANLVGQFIVAVFIYRRVMELEWREIYALSLLTTWLEISIATYVVSLFLAS